jgi:hypothetical protein
MTTILQGHYTDTMAKQKSQLCAGLPLNAPSRSPPRSGASAAGGRDLILGETAHIIQERCRTRIIVCTNRRQTSNCTAPPY